ncbi:MAG TPA: hypothetical protein VJ841_02120 [Candidatus Saccharimonadales bacterium]|nr:hypothetical protein [Candidatus Saccharimonadales bacterium]
MKTDVINTIKTILSDRLMTILLIVLFLLGIAYTLFVVSSLHPNDLQVAVHYSSYGDTTFYRDKWYYLITFAVFGVGVVILHTILAAKIYMQGRREMALLFVLLSYLLIVVAWFIARSILRVAFL